VLDFHRLQTSLDHDRADGEPELGNPGIGVERIPAAAAEEGATSQMARY